MEMEMVIGMAIGTARSLDSNCGVWFPMAADPSVWKSAAVPGRLGLLHKISVLIPCGI
jgi:hypothetical protein